MFVSINHIPVKIGREADFEIMFQQREHAVENQPGFISLDVLKPGNRMAMGGALAPNENVYQVLTRWKDEESFNQWVGSDAFRKAHSRNFDTTVFDGKSHLTVHETIVGVGASAG